MRHAGDSTCACPREQHYAKRRSYLFFRNRIGDRNRLPTGLRINYTHIMQYGNDFMLRRVEAMQPLLVRRKHTAITYTQLSLRRISC